MLRELDRPFQEENHEPDYKGKDSHLPKNCGILFVLALLCYALGNLNNLSVLHLTMPLPARAGIRAAALFSLYALILGMALHIAGVVIPALHEEKASSAVFASRGAAGGKEQERGGDQSSHGVQYSLKH